MLTASSGLGSHRITCFLGSHRWELSSQVSHWLPPVQIAYAGDRPGFKCKVCQISLDSHYPLNSNPDYVKCTMDLVWENMMAFIITSPPAVYEFSVC